MEDLEIYIMNVCKERNITKKRLLRLKGLLNLIFDYATSPKQHLVESNPLPKNNTAFLKQCDTRVKKPEEKAFQPDELKKISAYLWERVQKSKYDINGYPHPFSAEFLP